MDIMIDFSGIIPPQKLNGLKKFQININGIYGWGTGYYTDALIYEFRTFIRENLQYHLDELINDSVMLIENDDYSCDEIKGRKSYNHSYIYLHPMQFTGYLAEEDVQKVCDYINYYFKSKRKDDTSEEISANIAFMEDTALISDDSYSKLICEYSKEIIDRVKQYYNKLSPQKKESFKTYGYSEVGFDFAKTARINRTNDGPGLSSSDVDVSTVNMIVKIAIDNNLLDV